MIGQIAGHGGFNGFSINMKELTEKLLPTTNYFGKLNEQLEYLETIISTNKNRSNIEVSSLPYRIGARQLDIPAYPSRPFYILDFSDYKLEDRITGRLEDENDVNEIQTGIEKEKLKIKKNMPIKITIEREPNEDIELLRIDEVMDKEGNSVSRNFFRLQIQSMSEVDNFWLDSGIFSLNINNS